MTDGLAMVEMADGADTETDGTDGTDITDITDTVHTDRPAETNGTMGPEGACQPFPILLLQAEEEDHPIQQSDRVIHQEDHMDLASPLEWD